MAMVPGNDFTVTGKKTVWTIMIGFLLFTVGMSFLTYGIAQATTPYFKELEARRRAENGRDPEAPKATAPEAGR